MLLLLKKQEHEQHKENNILNLSILKLGNCHTFQMKWPYKKEGPFLPSLFKNIYFFYNIYFNLLSKLNFISYQNKDSAGEMIKLKDPKLFLI